MPEKEEKDLKFLGLGSMVEVKNLKGVLPDSKYVIIARAVGKDSTGKTILRYRLAPHPFGDVPAYEDAFLTVEEGQIKKVYTKGYVDQKDETFLDEMLEQMAGAMKKMQEAKETKETPISKKIQAESSEIKQAKVENQEKTAALDEEAMLKKDPFYKFR